MRWKLGRSSETRSSRAMDCSRCYHQAAGSPASYPTPAAWAIDSTHRLSERWNPTNNTTTSTNTIHHTLTFIIYHLHLSWWLSSYQTLTENLSGMCSISHSASFGLYTMYTLLKGISNVWYWMRNTSYYAKWWLHMFTVFFFMYYVCTVWVGVYNTRIPQECHCMLMLQALFMLMMTNLILDTCVKLDVSGYIFIGKILSFILLEI